MKLCSSRSMTFTLFFMEPSPIGNHGIGGQIQREPPASVGAAPGDIGLPEVIAHDPPRTRIRSFGVGGIAVGVEVLPVQAPFQDITADVLQLPGIGRQHPCLMRRSRFLRKRSFLSDMYDRSCLSWSSSVDR